MHLNPRLIDQATRSYTPSQNNSFSGLSRESRLNMFTNSINSSAEQPPPEVQQQQQQQPTKGLNPAVDIPPPYSITESFEPSKPRLLEGYKPKDIRNILPQGLHISMDTVVIIIMLVFISVCWMLIKIRMSQKRIEYVLLNGLQIG